MKWKVLDVRVRRYDETDEAGRFIEMWEEVRRLDSAHDGGIYRTVETTRCSDGTSRTVTEWTDWPNATIYTWHRGSATGDPLASKTPGEVYREQQFRRGLLSWKEL